MWDKVVSVGEITKASGRLFIQLMMTSRQLIDGILVIGWDEEGFNLDSSCDELSQLSFLLAHFCNDHFLPPPFLSVYTP